MNMFREDYVFTIHFNNGYSLTTNMYEDLFEDKIIKQIFTKGLCDIITVKFNPRDTYYDQEKRMICVDGNKLETHFHTNDSAKEFSGLNIEYLSIQKQKQANMHYAV